MKTLNETLQRLRLSVAMIVRDEQDVLADSMESVREIADEIVVLDTGSTDQTIKLAKRLGAIVHKKAWADDFAAARNHCMKFVTGDWVLWLDAGETIGRDSAIELRRFVTEEANRSNVHSLWVEVPSNQPAVSAEQCRQARLVPSHLNLQYTGRVRESLEFASLAASSEVAEAPGRIIRHPRQHEVERTLAKARRDLALAELEICGGDQGSVPLLVAGEAHSVLGDFEQARTVLRQAASAAPADSTLRLEAYYSLLTTFDDEPDLHANQLTACLDALESFPFDMQLLLALGNYMLVRGRVDLAVRAFDAAVRFGRVTTNVWHLCEVRDIASVCLSLALQSQQRDDEARAALETGLAAHPDSVRLLHQLYLLYGKQGKRIEAAAIEERLPRSLVATSTEVSLPSSDGQQVRIDVGRTSRGLPPHAAIMKPQRAQ